MFYVYFVIKYLLDAGDIIEKKKKHTPKCLIKIKITSKAKKKKTRFF